MLLWKRSGAISLLLFALVSCGCGGAAEDAPELIEAFGTVTLDGKPLPNARVMFSATDQAATVGRTDENGYYEIYYNDGIKGAFPGTNTVRISTAMDYNRDPDDDEDEFQEKLEETLPAFYNGMGKLVVGVKEGGAPYDFPLTSDPKNYKGPAP